MNRVRTRLFEGLSETHLQLGRYWFSNWWQKMEDTIGFNQIRDPLVTLCRGVPYRE